MSKKLPNKLIPFAQALDLYNQDSVVKVDFIVPTLFKIFSKKFDYCKLLKNGLPSLDDIYQYFGYPEIKNTQVLLPAWYYRRWKEGDLLIKTIKIEGHNDSGGEILFVELGTGDEVLDTFVFFDSTFGLEYSFERAFEFLKESQEKEAEIINIIT
jgi:hypothetical protein